MNLCRMKDTHLQGDPGLSESWPWITGLLNIAILVLGQLAHRSDCQSPGLECLIWKRRRVYTVCEAF